VAGVDWYHTIDLGQGLVTDGFVDHRYQLPIPPPTHWPASVPDVATFDGYRS
jgi:hypothetical protein